MQYPKEMQIVGNTINVTILSEPIKQTGPNSYMIGMYHPISRNLIQYHDDKFEDTCGESFVHETVEAVNAINDLGLPHQTITTLAANLYQAFTSGHVSFAKEVTCSGSTQVYSQ